MDDTLCDFIGPFKSGEYKLKYPKWKNDFSNYSKGRFSL